MRKSPVLLVTAAAAVLTCVSTAQAAAPLPQAPVPYVGNTWTGLYFGGEAGWGWATQQITHVTGGTSFPAGFVDGRNSFDGPLAGLYVGYNYQVNQILVGIDGDIAAGDPTGTSADVSPANGNIARHSLLQRWIGTVTGRVGYISGDVLWFAKGGWGWAAFSDNNVLRTPGGGLVNTSSSADTRNGWTLGGGLEWGFAAHWSAKLEYDYLALNTASYNSTITSAGGAFSTEARSATSSIGMLTAGVAYRF